MIINSGRNQASIFLIRLRREWIRQAHHHRVGNKHTPKPTNDITILIVSGRFYQNNMKSLHLYFSGSLILSNIPRPIHYDKDTNKAYYTANQIIPVRNCFVYFPSPQDRHNYEYSTIGSVNPAKMGWLKSWDYSIKHQNYPSQYTNPDTIPFSQPQPDKVSTAYFTKPGKYKQYDRLSN